MKMSVYTQQVLLLLLLLLLLLRLLLIFLLLILQPFDWLAAFHLGLSIILHRVPPQVADRGTLCRYRGYWGNKIPRADLKTDLRRATQRLSGPRPKW